MYIRQCTICKIRAYNTYDLEFFVKNKRHLHGRLNRCKPCSNKIGRTKGAGAKEKYQVNKRYNKSREDYITNMRSSKICQICGSGEKKLCYDHDHKTDKFRGVLCRGCNASIGQLGDTAETVGKAYKYLIKCETKSHGGINKMEDTNPNELMEALDVFKEKYGEDEPIDMFKIDDIIRELRQKQNKGNKEKK